MPLAPWAATAKPCRAATHIGQNRSANSAIRTSPDSRLISIHSTSHSTLRKAWAMAVLLSTVAMVAISMVALASLSGAPLRHAACSVSSVTRTMNKPIPVTLVSRIFPVALSCTEVSHATLLRCRRLENIAKGLGIDAQFAGQHLQFPVRLRDVAKRR